MAGLSLPAPLKAWWQTYRWDVLICTGYAVAAGALMSPALLNLRTVAYGNEGDSFLWMWMGWWRKYALLNGLNYEFITLSNAPFGTDHAFRAYFGTVMSLALLAIAVNEVAAYNLLIFIGWVLSAGLSYALCRKLGASRLASLAGGAVYGFSAYALLHVRYHVDQSQQWVIPLCALALAHFHSHKSWPSALLLGLALGIGLHFHAYYGFFSGVIIALYVGYRLWHRPEAPHPARTHWLLMLAAAGLLAALIYGPELVNIYRELRGIEASPLRAGSVIGRPYTWFFDLALRPWDLFLPPTDHPLWGGFSAQAYAALEGLGLGDFTPTYIEAAYRQLGQLWFWVRAGDPNSNDRYLGYPALLLAIYGAWGLLRTSHQRFDPRRWWAGFALVIGCAGIIFALPPYLPVGAFLAPLWGPMKEVILPLPAWLIMTFLSPLRNVARFILLTNLALAVLTTYGLDRLAEVPHLNKHLPAFLVGFLVLFSLERLYPFEVHQVVPPEEFRWLAEQAPGTIAATYPYHSRTLTMYQAWHQQPLLDTIGGQDGNFVMDNLYQIGQLSHGDLSAPETPARLAARGVSVVIDTEKQLAQPSTGLSLLFSTPTADVYRVTAAPARIVVLHTLTEGLWRSPAEWAGQGQAFSFLAWNPLNVDAPLRITAQVSGAAPGARLALERVLTPPPAEVILSGYRVPNPSIPPDYPAAALSAEVENGQASFEAVPIHPGETIITLRWGTAGSAYPHIDTISFSVEALSLEE